MVATSIRILGPMLNSIEERTSILTGDEVDPLPQLDLEVTMAHEVLQPYSGDNPGPGLV